MRSRLRFVVLIGALGLIAYGLFQPVERDGLWLICLWAAAPLLGLAAWLTQSPMPRGFPRSVYNLGLVIAVGFVLISLQLLRQQVVRADDTYNRVEVDAESGQVISNVRPVLAAQRVQRGTIFDQNELPLVQSERNPDGTTRRIYPLADRFDPTAFSNIVGFFSIRFGQSGLEASYSDYLSGERGNSLEKLRDTLLGEPQQGNNLHLTLDAALQAQSRALLGGQTGSIVVLNPRTGAVLAMVSTPGFDPRLLTFNPAAEDRAAENVRIEQYWGALNSDAAGQPLLNRPTQGQYPPGSTFKTVTAVGVLEHPDVGDPNNITCPNQLEVEPGSPPVVNAVPNLAGLTGNPSTLERVYAYSCNAAFAQYALRLGADLMTETARQFDIFSPQEAPGSYSQFTDLPTIASRLYVQPGFLNRPAALADTGYGQGQILITPLQMAMVAAAIANDGVMMRPYLVERITDPAGGLIRRTFPQPIRRAMSQETAAAMRDNMRAVADYGFGSVVSSFVPSVDVGGKSGTAEHAGPVPHAWFIAIAPVDDPRYAVAVMVENGGEGSGIAAQLAGQVLQLAFELNVEGESESRSN